MRIVVIVLATVLSLESGRAALTYAQTTGGCDGTRSVASAAECQAGQRIFQDPNVFVDRVANRVTELGLAAFDASIQSAGQGLAGRASIIIGNVEVALQQGIAQTDPLLSSTRGLLDQSDQLLLDSDDVLNESNQVLNDSDKVLKRSKDVLKDSKKILKESNDLLDQMEPVVAAGEAAELQLRKRIEQTEARVGATVTRLRQVR